MLSILVVFTNLLDVLIFNNQEIMFKQKPLPFMENGLEPFFSRSTLSFHYGKHHAGYINKLNELVKDTKYEKLSLEEIIKSESVPVKIYNNAAQAWNHEFFWNCLTPPSKFSHPKGSLKREIEKTWGSYDEFVTAFTTTALDRFGSGWCWLYHTTKGLKINTFTNAHTPWVTDVNHTPLLVCDVWEHAYYLDYQNDRAGYIKAFFNLIDWSFIEKNYLRLKM